MTLNLIGFAAFVVVGLIATARYLLWFWPGHVSCPARLYDPEYNLRVGLRLWRSQGWSPWAL